jgi:CheY-like chemotaxis protein
MKTQTDSAVSAALKILLVDDVPQGTVARKSVLSSLGHQVETAESGHEALVLLASHPFDLMITDYKMPTMDGLELIRCVRETYPSIRIVLLSALAEMLGFTAQSSGADAVIAKSNTELDELTRTIKNLFARRTGRKPPASQKKPPLFMVKSS